MNRPVSILACAFAAIVAGLAGAAYAQPAAEPVAPAELRVEDAVEPAAAAMAAVDVVPARTGHDVYRRFREGLAQPECAADASSRWRSHFSAAPRRLASSNDDVLPLFAYVVDALREAHLPTEYALIPFVESGYKPGARSPLGPTGMWQMIAVTARNHKVPIRNGYDGRLSPVDSTRAAVRYLKTLHGMFAGDWRLAAMAYNAGEYRIFGALKRGGQVARDARPEQLPGLAPITQAYVRKLHALACLLTQAEDDENWMRAMDRPVPELKAVTLPRDVRRIEGWAARTGQDPAQLRRLNPLLANRGSGAMRLLVVSTPSNAAETLAGANPVIQGDPPARDTVPTPDTIAGHPRRHTVVRGESLSGIAQRYGVRISELLDRNDLTLRSILRPGRVLQIDPGVPPGS